MLNVYDKYERPEELNEYKEIYPFLGALRTLKYLARKLTEEDKDILSKHIGFILKNADLSYRYAKWVVNGRWEDAEPIIMKEPKAAYIYAKDVIKGRWEDAEPIIMKDPEYAYNYALNIIKGRWKEAEPAIMSKASSAYSYAHDILKGRWKDIGHPEAEDVIAKNMYYAYYYAQDIIKGRWEEAEPYIKQDSDIWACYREMVRAKSKS